MPPKHSNAGDNYGENKSRSKSVCLLVSMMMERALGKAENSTSISAKYREQNTIPEGKILPCPQPGQARAPLSMEIPLQLYEPQVNGF
jgi:hypothetical protein